tara:strand:+ start:3266 stop:3721 length:456 start_codon:yes stop_codon:yes gene_type:complete
MKGIQGNFMSEPRVFAHSARNITPSSDSIPLVDQRGVALYVGTGGDVIVRMEGTHMTTDPLGNSWKTNICVFKNIPNGLFMPTLVTHVLDNNEEEWLAYIEKYEIEIRKIEEQKKQTEQLIAQLQEDGAVIISSLKEATKEYTKNCDISEG